MPGPIPRFVANPRPRRDRVVLAIAITAAVITVVSVGLDNVRTRSLRCEDGQIVPHRGGLFPWVERPLADPTMPPLPVPPELCRHLTFTSHAALEQRYAQLASRVPLTTRAPSPSPSPEPESAKPAPSSSPSRSPRERAVEELRGAVGELERAHEDVRAGLERARQAGVSDAELAPLERRVERLASPPERRPSPERSGERSL